MNVSLGGILRGIVSQTIGLIVDDGFIAVGAVAALVATGVLALPSIDLVPHDSLGVVLFAIVTVVLLGSLVRAGRAARMHAVEAPAANQPG
jgi:hypothetical protein